MPIQNIDLLAIFRGMNISEYTAKIDKLFLTAQLYPELGIKTIGIGDGAFTRVN